ncbi:MAG TPA: RNA-binding S4 domain-containing protein [Opitutaceae bacterium]|nr:RNA-binding S4 domain-containing protein [Opitutaceae bacterium]
MSNDESAAPKIIPVRSVPIELCQFIKFGGLAGSGGAAKAAIGEGKVRVNGAIETQKRKKLIAGDRVTLDGRTLVVHLR